MFTIEELESFIKDPTSVSPEEVAEMASYIKQVKSLQPYGYVAKTDVTDRYEDKPVDSYSCRRRYGETLVELKTLFDLSSLN